MALAKTQTLSIWEMTLGFVLAAIPYTTLSATNTLTELFYIDKHSISL